MGIFVLMITQYNGIDINPNYLYHVSVDECHKT